MYMLVVSFYYHFKLSLYKNLVKMFFLARIKIQNIKLEYCLELNACAVIYSN